MKQYTKQYIGGQWREGRGKEMSNFNPYTNELLYTYKGANQEDVDDAYKAAQAAQVEWAATTPAHKIQMLKKLIPAFESLREDMIACDTEEGGKSIHIGGVDLNYIIEAIEDAIRYPTMIQGTIMPSNIPGRECYGYKVPKGVIGVISPWNHLFVLAMRYTLPAIACGNAVVLKPSSETPGSAMILAEAFDKAGFPAGLFNVVAGAGSEIGDYFVTHPIPAMHSFTGSTETGRRISELAGRHFKDVALEMGGNNVMIVLDDADVSKAIKSVGFGKFLLNGQVCMAVNRFIVMDAVHDRFVEELTAMVKSLKCGNPSDPTVNIGPLINNTQVKSVEAFVEKTLQAGATVAVEGKTEGNVVHPWVLTNVSNKMPTACCEVFGPVCSVIKVSSEEEAIAVANDTEYGLSGCVWTEDIFRGIQVSKKVQTGNMHINSHPISAEYHVLFGGEKSSGRGRSGGQWYINSFTKEVLITVNL
ncbi:MAG: aldehyde dehydrogenase family protein [Oscillospiraceae bacterium]|nr:aldehyde dehydrogenase family protein [Oscillospiraceae bacterium]